MNLRFPIPWSPVLCTLAFLLSCTPAPRESATPAPADDAPPYRQLISSLRAADDALEDVPFQEVIEAATGRRILPVDPESSPDSEIIEALRETLGVVLSRLNSPESPTRGLRRINEASRFVEDMLVELLSARPGFTCSFPPNAEGGLQRSGYPDLRLVHEASGRVAYIDPKLFEQSGKESSLRTFYFQPRTRTNKILEDAHHLLVGIAHDGNDPDWKFLNWHLVDLSGFRIGLKAEFQASNRDLYRPELIISTGGM